MENTIKTYTVPSSRIEELEKKLSRLQRKASKYDCSLEWSVGEEHLVEQKVFDKVVGSQGYTVEKEVASYGVICRDVSISTDAIKKGNYSVIAKVEPIEEGKNFVAPMGDNEEIDLSWTTCLPTCEHCKSFRRRKALYIVRNENSQLMVGRSCLKDYCGINPEMAVLAEEIRDIYLEDEKDGTERFSFNACDSAYNPVELLAHSFDVIAEQGYIRADESKSNKDAIGYRTRRNEKPSEKSMKKAEEMAAKLLNDFTNDDLFTDRLLLRVRQSLDTQFCRSQEFGFFAYAPIAFESLMKKIKADEDRKAAKESEAQSSQYVGEIGQKLQFKTSSAKLLTSYETQWGYTHVYKFVDENGNVFIWKSGASINAEEATMVKGTVKDHSEYDGVKQTILTRCKVA